MKFTHRKRAYHAQCVQWTGDNTADIEAFFPPPIEVLTYESPILGKKSLLIRFAPGELCTMYPRDWAVKGENGGVKVYSDDIFHVKYEELP